MRLAARMDHLGTETAFEVLAKAKAMEARGRDVIHLEIGEPDFDTPAHIVDAAVKALREGQTHYSPASGVVALREQIAATYSERLDWDVPLDSVVVTPGAKPIMFYVMMAYLETGDEVIYPNPGFPIYESMINYLDATPVPLPLVEEREFNFDIDHLKSLVTDRTRLIILNSPQNPTGGVLGEAELRAVAELALERGILVLSDEVYNQILYSGRHASMAALPEVRDHLVLLDGFSKTYAMTGWRLGFGIMPAKLAAAVTQLMINSNSCTATFSQYAAIAALTGTHEPVRQMVAEFKRRRDVIVDGLNALPGVSCLLPNGAFYVFPNIKQLGRPCKEVADFILEDAGVAVLAGTAFGEYGDGYLRLSYANSVESIRAGLARMADSLEKLS